jgi:hypothetical protein
MVSFENAPPVARELLGKRVRDVGMSIESSPVAPLVKRLYSELEFRGLRHFRPRCYLSDEWGSPSGEPVIGIPFYLGDRRVADLEAAANDVEDEREIMMYLRHEAGHAFNHAYELDRTESWRDVFGSSRRPYRDDYPFLPFSRDYVRHIAGWYAQKHPDEDFAETFAVWLDPLSNWRQRYENWGAIRKLQYVDARATELGDTPPLRSDGATDITVDEMEHTVEEMFRQYHIDESELIGDLALDADLGDIFPGGGDEPAVNLIGEHRRDLVDKVHYWTGVRRTLARALVQAIEQRVRDLGLTASGPEIVELTVYLTTLAMTFLTGKRPLRHRRTK